MVELTKTVQALFDDSVKFAKESKTLWVEKLDDERLRWSFHVECNSKDVFKIITEFYKHGPAVGRSVHINSGPVYGNSMGHISADGASTNFTLEDVKTAL